MDGLVQDCSNSSALAMELVQSCAKPLLSHRYIQLELPILGFSTKCFTTLVEVQQY